MNTLEQAVRLSMEEWTAALPQEVPAYTHSEKYEKAIRRLFDKTRNNRYHRLTKRTVKALLIAAILLAIAIAATAIAVPKGNLFRLQLFNDHATITSTDTNRINKINSLTIDYLPEGFTITRKEEYHIHYGYTYAKGDSFFSVEKSLSNSVMGFDTTDNVETLIDNDTQYTYYEGDGIKGFIWYSNGYMYSCDGNIGKDELFKIAQSVY